MQAALPARKTLVKSELVLNFISITLYQRVGGTVHDATVRFRAKRLATLALYINFTSSPLEPQIPFLRYKISCG